MTRIAVTKGTLRIPPTYFAVQHTQRLLADEPQRWNIRTFTMALELTDPRLRSGALDIVETAAFSGGSFRRREVTMPLSFRRMARAIAAFEPEVVHQHFATWSSPAVHAASTLKVPLLVTLHGADVFAALRPVSSIPLRGRPMLSWHHRSVRAALAAARVVLPVSEFLAARAIEAGADASRLHVHYQGIDTDYFTPGESGNLGAEPEIVFVGALSRAKGVLDLVQASIAEYRAHSHRLVVIGRGPLEAHVRAAAVEHPHIEVTGALDQSAVRARLRGARALVLPTQHDNGWREAAGLVLLEAQACGVPVIAYASGGAPEMLQPGRTGLVVPERDIDALGGAIRAMLTLSATERTAMGADARRFVVEQRSLAASARQLAELYSSAAGSLGA